MVVRRLRRLGEQVHEGYRLGEVRKPILALERAARLAPSFRVLDSH
jgi:hypothetical protein